VRQPGHENAFEIGDDPLERLSLLRRRGRQRLTDVTRRDARQNRVALGIGQVRGDPVDQRVAVGAELFGVQGRR
jgi:hypothetical protein